MIPSVTRHSARTMATAGPGSRKSSPSGYGFTVFVLLSLVAEELKTLSH